jgi:putative flippase GtrA
MKAAVIYIICAVTIIANLIAAFTSPLGILHAFAAAMVAAACYRFYLSEQAFKRVTAEIAALERQMDIARFGRHD